MPTASDPDLLPAFCASHDHLQCIDQALSKARLLCQRQRARLTPVRERVLELIWQSHKPLGAYQILERLAQDGFNSAPPTVYRALEFLLEQGLAHRITSLNAFIGCCHPEHCNQGCFLICRKCGSAQELALDALSSQLKQIAAAENFLLEAQILELSGLCPDCQRPPQEPAL